ncbi:MAG: protein kinase [Potamolinea sp.]
MSYCLNLRCQKPQNPDNARFCSNCGSRLLLGDSYRAIKLISQGGIGRTFLAVDEQDTSNTHCIIKQLSAKNQGTNNAEKAAELFRIEAVRLQELGQHPQIPQLLAYFEPENLIGTGMVGALVQTFIEGKNLAQTLQEQGTFSETQIRKILTELLPVLQFVHERGVIHRDINPENIIRRTPPNPPFVRGGIEEESNPPLPLPKGGTSRPPFSTLQRVGEETEGGESELILVDFGAAKFTTKTALAKTGTTIGSAAYTASEQLMGKAFPNSDLYSLAVTCIHLLTNIHPFDLFSSLEGVWVWQDYLIEPVSEQLRAILDKMLSSTPRLRYQSAAEILKALNPESNIETTPATFIQPSSSVLNISPKSFTPTWKCIRTLKEHLSSINSIAFSPDRETIASGSADRTIKLWYINSTVPCWTLGVHSSLVDAIAFSPDGQTIASGSWDYTIKIWDVETGELIHTFGEHSGWIKCIAISSDRQILASGSADRTIKIWNLNTGEVQKTLSGHSSAVHSIVISQDGKTLVSSSADQTIKVWNLDSGEVKLTLEGHTEAVNSLTLSPTGQILISGSSDKTIKIWHLNSGTLLHTLTSHTEAVNSVAINAQGNTLISGSADKTVKIWHPGSGELLHTLNEHTASVTAVDISPDSYTLVSGSQDKTIKIWKLE